jgi:hypothetical protein
MTGQIPKYGRHFRRESTPWTPGLANRVYVLTRDPSWFIRSDKASKTWRVYNWHLDHERELAAPIGTSLPTLGMAVNRLLEGIDRGFYQTARKPASTPGTGPEIMCARDAQIRIYDRADGTDDASDMYVMEVLNVTVLVRLTTVEGFDEGEPDQAEPYIAVEAGGRFTVSVNEDPHIYNDGT